MPLNYSKWDQLELSDDSDIEGHPNVDKKSLIRWKQRDIHEKREVRKQKIQHLEAQIACNKVLLPKITDIANKLADSSLSVPPTKYWSNLIEQLEKNPSRDCPPGNDPTKFEQTYDGMLFSLFQRVTHEAKEKVKQLGLAESEKEERLGKELAIEMATHVTQLGETIARDEKEAEEETAEQKKKITTDDIHEGFETKYVPPKPEPAPVPHHKGIESRTKEKQKVTEVEILNPKAVEKSSASDPEPDADEDEASLPQMTSSLTEFSKISVGQYEKSFQFIQQHRDVYVPGASDALLVAAFEAQSDGKSKYARQCIHQSLLLQYCEKLGRDGVGVFFRKMLSGDKRVEKVFVDDFENTYKHLAERARIHKEQAELDNAGREQIQLVPENPETTISFNVPDGPPPEDLRLEGPGTEDLDIEQVRQALQYRWDTFQSFSNEMQKALASNSLEAVNKVLGNMDVSEAETLVGALDSAGILNFAEGGIKDQTEEEAGSSSE